MRFASFIKEDMLLELWLQEQKFGIATSCSEQLKFFELDTYDEVVLASARQGTTPSGVLKVDDCLLEASRLLPTHVRLSASVVSAPKGAQLFCAILDQHRSLATLLPKSLAVATPMKELPLNGQGCVVSVPPHMGGGLTRGLVVSSDRLVVTVTLIDLDMSQVCIAFIQTFYANL